MFCFRSDQSKRFVVAISFFSGDLWQLHIRQLLTAFAGWDPFPTLLCSHPSGIALMACGMVGGAFQMNSPVHRVWEP